MIDKIYTNKGYTLLFSIIVASIVLSIAAFILSVSRKEFILSSTARDSIVSIYAAESGIQCVVQALRIGALATTSGFAYIYCDNNEDPFVSWNTDYNSSVPGLYRDEVYKIERFENLLTIMFPNNACARVDVIQGYDEIDHTKHKVIIESRGYNMQNSQPCTENGVVNPRTVERAIRLEYFN